MAKKSYSNQQIELIKTANPILNKKIWFALGIIMITVLLCYWPTLKNNFVFFDDDTHLLENTAIRGLDFKHIQQIFTTTVDRVYAPLTFFTFAIEYHFFKYTPFIYHFINLLLHMGVTSLVFYFALQLGLPLRAAFAAGLLFGIHPMHVESVAWVTERKDVLYAFFYMSALISYLKYLTKRNIILYVTTLVFGLLSILAKPMALSLPLVLLLCDWFKKRSFDRSMICDKIPHFLYVISIAWITYSVNARIPGDDIHSAVLIWIWTAVFYIHKFFFPLTLIPMYALPQPITLTNLHYAGAFALFILLVFILFLFRRHRWVWFAALFYFLSIFFLFRFDNAVDKNIVADRFIYLPCLGICLLIGYGLNKLFERIETDKKALRSTLSFILVIMVIILSGKTFQQTHVWRNSIVLWNHELKYYPNNALAYGNRGEAYKDLGKFDLALDDFNKSIIVDPNYAESYNSRGQLHAQQGNLNAALKDFEQAIQLKPHFDEAYNNLGIIYAMNNDKEKSLFCFKKAIELDRYNSEAHINLGDFYYQNEHLEQALFHFQKVLDINPNSAIGYNKRGLILGIKGDSDLALKDFNQSIKINPNNSEAYINRGIVFEQKRLFQQALESYTTALKINPRKAAAYYGRGNIYVNLGMPQQAVQEFKRALEINPHHHGAKRNQDVLNKILNNNSIEKKNSGHER